MPPPLGFPTQGAHFLHQRFARPTRSNGEPYRGINVVLLWQASVAAGYSSPFWFTFKQAVDAGAHVGKGERSTLVVYAGSIDRTQQNDAGDEIERRIPFLKSYCVFNAAQIDGLDAAYHPVAPVPRPLAEDQRLPHVDAFFANTGATIRHGGDNASYSQVLDLVRMPPFHQFVSAEAYAATLAHEIIHWTRHSSQLDRDFAKSRYGDDAYAREELVAELGACFLAADLGLAVEPRDDHAAYIASWLKVLKNDKRAIFQAAAYAQKASDYLHGLQPAADA